MILYCDTTNTLLAEDLILIEIPTSVHLQRKYQHYQQILRKLGLVPCEFRCLHKELRDLTCQNHYMYKTCNIMSKMQYVWFYALCFGLPLGILGNCQPLALFRTMISWPFSRCTKFDKSFYLLRLDMSLVFFKEFYCTICYLNLILELMM